MSAPFVTEETAKAAVAMTLPAILQMMHAGIFKRKHLHIVVMDPAKPFSGGYEFEHSILYEYSIGSPGEWQWPYGEIAASKAEVTWRTGHPTRAVRDAMPHLYEPGDTKYIGSVISRCGRLIVGVSGVQDYFDEMIAKWIVSAIEALAIQEAEAARKNEGDTY